MRGTDEITNSEDIIDSRDVIARIEYLQDERDNLEELITEDGISDEVKAERERALAEWDNGDEGQELKALKALAEEASGYPDWTYGEMLIRDSYFEDYARELAEDIGAIPKNLGWPCNHIDWEGATNALKMDYFSVEFDGVEYWIRA